jgi:small subunit ribosomal protein SAe
VIEYAANRFCFADRDPELEAEDKAEEEKAAEETTTAVETGFAGATGDWEAAPAGFPAAATGADWTAEGTAAGWDASAAAPTEWAADAPAKDPSAANW